MFYVRFTFLFWHILCALCTLCVAHFYVPRRKEKRKYQNKREKEKKKHIYNSEQFWMCRGSTRFESNFHSTHIAYSVLWLIFRLLARNMFICNGGVAVLKSEFVIYNLFFSISLSHSAKARTFRESDSVRISLAFLFLCIYFFFALIWIRRFRSRNVLTMMILKNCILSSKE